MNARVTGGSSRLLSFDPMFTSLLIAAAAASGHFTAHSDRVTNPWFPLKPGAVYHYRGVKDGKPSRDIVTVTHTTKTIQGVRCASVKDRLYLEGKLEERTTDWYAQDTAGNV